MECCEQSQVLYVIPVSSILGQLPLVPVGQTGTIPFQVEMRRESAGVTFQPGHCAIKPRMVVTVQVVDGGT
jgi:hypothetical protein